MNPSQDQYSRSGIWHFWLDLVRPARTCRENQEIATRFPDVSPAIRRDKLAFVKNPLNVLQEIELPPVVGRSGHLPLPLQ